MVDAGVSLFAAEFFGQVGEGEAGACDVVAAAVMDRGEGCGHEFDGGADGVVHVQDRPGLNGGGGG